MELSLDDHILKAYGLQKEHLKISQVGSGLINRTYLISSSATTRQYILQNINTEVFRQPQLIADNLRLIAAYLHLEHPDYLFIKPVKTTSGEEMVHLDNEYWRMLPFVADTVSLDVLTTEKQAYEAARQFGKLSRMLDGFEAHKLHATIPDFHNLSLRYDQFALALKKADLKLKVSAEEEIERAIDYRHILEYFNSFQHRKDFPDRVMHHDTKISNVLLNKQNDEGICVIDLDTIMPGKFLSDLGDMIRTYTCAFSENETDLSKIKIRISYFEALIKGYLSEMKSILTETEKELILFSGKYMVYMQALRFLTDFLNGNPYYPIQYPQQNLDRARNQFKLLQELYHNEKELQDIIEENLI